jgi:hypothetical protein
MTDLSKLKDSNVYNIANIKINDLFVELEASKNRFFAQDANKVLDDKVIGEVFVTSAAHLLIYSLMSCVPDKAGRLFVIDNMKAQLEALQPEEVIEPPKEEVAPEEDSKVWQNKFMGE